jgi:hypothetical protein
MQSRRPPAKPIPLKRATQLGPKRRTFILLETGLLLGLAEGVMWNLITTLMLSPYIKAALLMIGVVGLFAVAVRVLEPLIGSILNAIAGLEKGGGIAIRIGLHAVVLFLIYVGYVRVFFKV